MRTTLVFLLVVASLLTSGCKKRVYCCAMPNDAKWELRTRSGGIAGEIKNYPAGNGNFYLFQGNAYKLYTDGQMTKHGWFQIVQDSSYVLHQPASRIVFDNETNALRTLVKFSSNKMTIQEDVFDGRTYEYEKAN